MKKALRQLKRLTASFLCLLMVVGVLDFSVFAKDNTEDNKNEERFIISIKTGAFEISIFIILTILIISVVVIKIKIKNKKGESK